MNKKTAFFVAALYVAAGASVINYLHVRRVERQKRAEIQLNYERDLDAIIYAHEMVDQEVADGKHPFPNSVTIEESFHFHKQNAPSLKA